jgi:hypothetical protein
VAEDLRIRKVYTQTLQQGEERTLLGRSTSVSRFTLLIEPALVTDPDTVFIIVFGMSTLYILRAGEVQLSVPCDVVVVTDAVEASCPVACLQCLYRKVPVTAGRTTMNHNQIDMSHLQFF